MILNLKDGLRQYAQGKVSFTELRYFARTHHGYLLSKPLLDHKLPAVPLQAVPDAARHKK